MYDMICGKILEKIVFGSVYHFLNRNNLLSKNQSGFRPGDSTINQLLSITADIFQSFENYHETRAIFLDISKAFDKVWHEGLIGKLKSNGNSGSLLDFFTNYLSDRYQRIVLNGTESNWVKLTASVTQGSVLGPLLFLVYINDLTDNISCNMNYLRMIHPFLHKLMKSKVHDVKLKGTLGLSLPGLTSGR